MSSDKREAKTLVMESHANLSLIAVTCFMRTLKISSKKIITVLKTLWIVATCQERPLFLSPLSGRYWQIW